MPNITFSDLDLEFEASEAHIENNYYNLYGPGMGVATLTVTIPLAYDKFNKQWKLDLTKLYIEVLDAGAFYPDSEGEDHEVIIDVLTDSEMQYLKTKAQSFVESLQLRSSK